jgi:hypothetical protein
MITTTHTIDGCLENGYIFHATVDIDWVMEDNGIGTYEYWGHLENYVSFCPVMNSWRVEEFIVYDVDDDGTSFESIPDEYYACLEKLVDVEEPPHEASL